MSDFITNLSKILPLCHEKSNLDDLQIESKKGIIILKEGKEDING